MDTHPMSNRLILDRKHGCRHSESGLHGQQNLDETQGRSKAGLQVRRQDHGAWGSRDISQMIRLKSGQQGGPSVFIHCWEMSKAEK